jgi:general secretion pathway protein K
MKATSEMDAITPDAAKPGAGSPRGRWWRRRVLESRRQRGAALIMVLGSLTILAVMLSEFQEDISTEFASAMSDRDALKAEYAAKSAINLSRLLIASEPTVRAAAGFLLAALGGGKAPQIPVWEFSGQILGAFSDATGAESFNSLGLDAAQGEGLGLDGAGFEVRIVDEDSKIGLNNAGRSSFGARDISRQLIGLIGGPQFDPLFEGRGDSGDYSSRSDICSAIIDWVDANQDIENCDSTSQAQSMGAEDSFYRNLRDPYQRKNAPFDSLEELRLVRGVGDDFWSTFIEPNPDEPKERPVSVWSSGKININTTSPRTLLSYICAWAVPDTPLCNDQTGELPAAFLSTMAMAQGMFAGIPIFRSPRQLREALEGKGQMASFLETAGVPKITFLSGSGFEGGLSLESKVFSIYADGYVRQGKRETRVRITAVVDFRKAPTVQDLIAKVGAGADQTQAAPIQGNQQKAEGTDGANTTGITGAIVPSTAGRVVYYRVN